MGDKVMVPRRPQPLLSFREHVQRWKDCRKCGLCDGRFQVVLARGNVPADVCFVGEAPGVSEDVIGQPFKGPAGHLLDSIVERALPHRVEIGEDGSTEHLVCELRVAYTNLVCCFPKEAKDAGTNEPPDDAVKACAPRLQEFVKLCDRGGSLKLIVAVGTMARDWLDVKMKGHVAFHRPIKIIDIVHPAFILRDKNAAQQGLLIQRAVVTLSNAVEGLS